MGWEVPVGPGRLTKRPADEAIGRPAHEAFMGRGRPTKHCRLQLARYAVPAAAALLRPVGKQGRIGRAQALKTLLKIPFLNALSTRTVFGTGAAELNSPCNRADRTPLRRDAPDSSGPTISATHMLEANAQFRWDHC